MTDYDENIDPEDYPEPEWYWIDSDEPASQEDAAEFPDAVYDARDPEWAEILGDDDTAGADEIGEDYYGEAEGEEFPEDYEGEAEPDGYEDDYGWVDDGDYVEVEIGIDYSPTGE